MAESETPSKVVPVLVAALLCDVGFADPATGKKNLIGVFNRLFVQTFPTARPLTLYWKLTDGEGHYRMVARIVRTDNNETIGEWRGEVELKDQLQAYDFLVNFPPVPFEVAGRYAFQILVNDVYLGSAILDAQIMPKK